jgi:hypothetical protein
MTAPWSPVSWRKWGNTRSWGLSWTTYPACLIPPNFLGLYDSHTCWEQNQKCRNWCDAEGTSLPCLGPTMMCVQAHNPAWQAQGACGSDVGADLSILYSKHVFRAEDPEWTAFHHTVAACYSAIQLCPIYLVPDKEHGGEVFIVYLLIFLYRCDYNGSINSWTWNCCVKEDIHLGMLWLLSSFPMKWWCLYMR